MKRAFFILLAFLSLQVFSQENKFSLIGHWAYGTTDCVVVNGNIAFIGSGSYISLIDISTPETPTEISKILMPSIVKSILIDGDYAYVANSESGLQIVDIKNVTGLSIVGSLDNDESSLKLFKKGNLVYLANERGGVQIVDVSQPSAPQALGSYSSGYETNDVFVEGDYAYLADSWNGLVIVDVTDPSNPTFKGKMNEEILGCCILVKDDYAYLGSSNGLVIINISDMSNPQKVAQQNMGRMKHELLLSDGYVYLTATQNGLMIVNVTDPLNPSLVSTFDTKTFARGVAKKDDLVLVTDSYSGLHILNATDKANLVETGFFQTSGVLNDVVVKNKLAYVSDMMNGLHILDVSDKSNVRRLASINPDDSGIPYRYYCLAVNDSMVYYGYDNGLYLINISDSLNPVVAGYLQVSPIEKMKLNGNYLYAAHGWGGFSVIDISDPSNLNVVGAIAGLMKAIDVQGNYAYTVGDNGMYMINVSDPTNPVLEHYHEVGNTFGRELVVEGNYAYVIGNTFNVMDIAVITNPTLISEISVGVWCTGMGKSGNDIYLADYGNYVWVQSGIRSIDIRDLNAPVENSFFGSGGDASYLFVDGTVIYLVDGDGGLLILKDDFPSSAPFNFTKTDIELFQNYPNPFQNSTTISYYLPENGAVQLKVYDALGREIDVLVDENKSVGTHLVKWNSNGFKGQELFYRLSFGGTSIARKMIVR